MWAPALRSIVIAKTHALVRKHFYKKRWHFCGLKFHTSRKQYLLFLSHWKLQSTLTLLRKSHGPRINEEFNWLFLLPQKSFVGRLGRDPISFPCNIAKAVNCLSLVKDGDKGRIRSIYLEILFGQFNFTFQWPSSQCRASELCPLINDSHSATSSVLHSHFWWRL